MNEPIYSLWRIGRIEPSRADVISMWMAAVVFGAAISLFISKAVYVVLAANRKLKKPKFQEPE